MISLHSVMLDLRQEEAVEFLWNRLQNAKDLRGFLREADRQTCNRLVHVAKSQQWNPFSERFVYDLMDPKISLQTLVMNDDTNHANASPIQTLPALREWSHWKRRAFIVLLCVLELAMISALVYGAVALWNMLEF